MKTGFIFSAALLLLSLSSQADAQVCLHEHVSFTGAPLCIEAGDGFDNLHRVFNDTASSISVPRGYSATVCQHAGFRNPCTTFNDDIDDLHASGFGDNISSIRVEFIGREPGRGPGRGPRPVPPSWGNPVRVAAQVNVGCKGRVESVELGSFVLSEDRGGWMTFHSANQVAHKCGETRHIGAEVWITVPRHSARVSSQGILLAPAVNADVRCEGRTWWTSGPCVGYRLFQ